MAACGYDEKDVADAPPIAGGGGQGWHMGGHYAYMAITAALVYRTITGHGQYIDASIHDACALTTEMHVMVYVYTGQVVRRQTGRHASATPSAPSQILCKDGKLVNAGIRGPQLTPQRVRTLAEGMDGHSMADDLMDEKYQDSAVVQENAGHITEVVNNFLASLTRDEVASGGQERGFNWGAIRTPDELEDDGHLSDRGFWTEVEHPELGRSFKYPGHAGIYNGSPWRISRRAPLIGEHNKEILCEELGLSRAELAVLAEGGVV